MRRLSAFSHRILPAAGAVLALAGWWAGTRFAAERVEVVAQFGPGPALRALAGLLADGTLFLHATLSIRRVLTGLALAVLVGVPLGLLTGSRRGMERATAPLFQFLRTISPLSWMPIAIMLMGVGDRAVVFLVALAAVWPILLNTAAGVRSLDPGWLLVARSAGAGPAGTLVYVVLPAILSHWVAGLRLALGIAWVILVPAEMLGVTSGLGYLVLDARDRLAYDQLVAVVLAIGAVGFLLDGAVRAVETRWGWQRR
ncbi:MAG TPA: ABC transporter permease [Thermaerobacter sp.]